MGNVGENDRPVAYMTYKGLLRIEGIVSDLLPNYLHLPTDGRREPQPTL